jgi:hypothetical protein
MADDRTLAPSPARWTQAWRAGLRPWSGWLWPAAACGVVAVVIDGTRDGGLPWLEPTPGSVAPAAFVRTIAAALALLFAVAGSVAVALAIASQRLGWISSLAQRRLQAAPSAPAILVRLLLCALLGTGVVMALVGVLAGAARAVGASEAGLTLLWLLWAERVATVLAIAFGLAAAAELLLDRRERGRRLWQTPQQALDEARAAGGRAR